MKQRKFTADFETATWNKNETWVWAWAVCSIDNPEKEILKGNNIESFIDLCKQGNDVYYFHNLKFDGEFIIYYLLKNGFKHVCDKKDAKDNTFLTLISDMGQFYSIEVYFKRSGKHVKKVTFYDSLKIIPLSVEQIANSFNLPISKLKIDYNKPRKKEHILTKEEEDYIENDVKIVALALKQMFNQKLTRMTQGSNALHNFKDTMTKSRWDRLFPKLDYDLDKILRESYKGGFTYLSPEFTEKDVYNIVNLDVNSLYPSIMYEKPMPISEPIYFKGQYKEDKIYNLYIQRFSCDFELKENKIPTVQIKHGYNFSANEYLKSSDYEHPTLVMTNVDFELFCEQYNIYDIHYVDGWKFKSMKGIFTEYIDKWIKVKNDATISGNSGLRTIAKRMLNSLYGKFATSLDEQDKIPYLDEGGIVHYTLGEEGRKKGLYLPIGSFITAFAREKTIKTSQAIMDYSIKKYGKNMYIYSDTDSIKTLLPIEELTKFCDIDPVKLGAWKFEGLATRGRFVRQKCYVEEIDEKLEITCAGLPKKCYDQVTWDNFRMGFVATGKLTFSHIKRWCFTSSNNFRNKRFYSKKKYCQNV